MPVTEARLGPAIINESHPVHPGAMCLPTDFPTPIHLRPCLPVSDRRDSSTSRAGHARRRAAGRFHLAARLDAQARQAAQNHRGLRSDESLRSFVRLEQASTLT